MSRMRARPVPKSQSRWKPQMERSCGKQNQAADSSPSRISVVCLFALVKFYILPPQSTGIRTASLNLSDENMQGKIRHAIGRFWTCAHSRPKADPRGCHGHLPELCDTVLKVAHAHTKLIRQSQRIDAYTKGPTAMGRIRPEFSCPQPQISPSFQAA